MPETLDSIINTQRSFFIGNASKNLFFRKGQLLNLYVALKDNEQDIYLALKKDLNKSEYEAFLTEYSIVCSELRYTLKNIFKLAKPRRVKTPISHILGNSFTLKEPYGVVLILSPWNYPFQLMMTPIIAAIAAGNCVICKTSPNSLAMANVIHKLLSETFKPYFLYSIDPQTEYEEILKQKYDYIFFTGSESVGKLVMRSASEHLTPISLELGGQSPCIIDKTANLKLAAKRILWGKLLNAGQTCVAPDYVLISPELKQEFLSYLLYYQKQMFPTPLVDDYYPKIINSFHFKRLIGLIERENNKTDFFFDETTQKIAPIFFTEATFESEIMQEEIFGPILPIITYNNINDAIALIKRRSKPLALYIFAHNNIFVQKLLREISFGSGCINDTVMQTANHHLPFGGVGGSGMGNYHGRYGVDTFSCEKGILKSATFIDRPFRYAPYQNKYLRFLKKVFTKWL